MKLSELKKLTNNDLASRFPFIIVRNWNGELAKDEDGNYYLEIDGMNGWRDILLCWAEKVKPIFDTLDKEVQKNFYIMECKEKWGCLRIDTTCIPTPKIDEYTSMAEHLSEWTCLKCGKITKSSNSKHLIIYRNVEVPFCKNCAKKDSSFKREVGDWYACFKRWKPDGFTEYIKYDCRELLEGVYD